ncbi:hypothetical protein [Endozoicomonas atrinae]|uniref:hypothetical protein n=1 Tax=Endozoicomonas atrinae TaxID=1333660 RepID=UPI0008263F35|nr:hypothetical protein [Endozoicomonas atrinae]
MDPMSANQHSNPTTNHDASDARSVESQTSRSYNGRDISISYNAPNTIWPEGDSLTWLYPTFARRLCMAGSAEKAKQTPYEVMSDLSSAANKLEGKGACWTTRDYTERLSQIVNDESPEVREALLKQNVLYGDVTRSAMDIWDELSDMTRYTNMMLKSPEPGKTGYDYFTEQLNRITGRTSRSVEPAVRN